MDLPRGSHGTCRSVRSSATNMTQSSFVYSAYGDSRSLDDLREYGKRLLATFPGPDATGTGRIKVPPEMISPLQADFEREREGDGGGLTGCREAVEILTRNPKKGKPVSPPM